MSQELDKPIDPIDVYIAQYENMVESLSELKDRTNKVHQFAHPTNKEMARCLADTVAFFEQMMILIGNMNDVFTKNDD